MFARNIALRLKANTPAAEFTKIFDKDVLPLLRKQKGFQDEILFSVPGGTEVIAISLWDSKESAEAYNTSAYPEAVKYLDKILDGAPRVRVSEVLSSTMHKPVAVAAA